nr:aminoglycoside phosphotransferase family protein [Streptomyces sp. RLB1-33]QIY74158.1 aminoglycoside phosphotransferase family protein [Streptomyces sp. RLB1-33]
MTQAPTPTADTVRRLARSLLAGSEAAGAGPDVRPVTEGAEHTTWWVGTRHVLRLAPDHETAVRRRRELRLRDLVRPLVGVAVPTSVAHGDWAGGLAYTLDTRLPGRSGEAQDVSPGRGGGPRRTADRAARGARTAGRGARGATGRAPFLEELRTAAERAAERLAAADEFDPGRLAQLTRPAAGQLAAQTAAAVLVHHGLKGEHLVVSADGRVRGVLDWTDAVLGDPAEDIAGLAIAVGAPAAVRAATLAGYGARPCLRGLWLSRCDTVIRLAERLRGRGEGPLPLLRTQLGRAWEPILLERVTDLPGDG